MREDLCSSRWARLARSRMILPEPVTLNRLAAPLCVFIFGIVAVVSSLIAAQGQLCLAERPRTLRAGPPRPSPLPGVNLYASVGAGAEVSTGVSASSSWAGASASLRGLGTGRDCAGLGSALRSGAR